MATILIVEDYPVTQRVLSLTLKNNGHDAVIAGNGIEALARLAEIAVDMALVDIAMEMLIQCGLSKTRARLVLAPLLQSNVMNLLTQMPARALTGTFARGDADTARRHVSAIKAHGLNDALAAYAILGKRSLELASQNGLDRKALVEIRNVIDEALQPIPVRKADE